MWEPLPKIRGPLPDFREHSRFSETRPSRNIFSLESNGDTWCCFCLFFAFLSCTAADNAGDYDSYGHRRCWTAAASCSYYSCRHHAKPVGIVLPCVCSRTRCCALCFVDDYGSVFRLMILFWIFSAKQQQTPQANTTATGTVAAGQQASCPYYSCRHRAKPVGLVLPRVCCSRIRAKNSFDLMTAESFAHFCRCNFWNQLKSLTIPEAIRHPTRETQEHRVTNTHFAAAPSAYGCSCRKVRFSRQDGAF